MDAFKQWNKLIINCELELVPGSKKTNWNISLEQINVRQMAGMMEIIANIRSKEITI